MPRSNQKLPPQSRRLNPSPEGQILAVKHSLDGFSQVTLDNGIPYRLHILTRAEDFPILLSSDLQAIRAHLLTRGPGHFRSKRNS